METNAFIDSLMREIIDPGVDRLMSSRYFHRVARRRAVKEAAQRLCAAALSV